MAGIDKTYTNSYEEYKEFKDWADKQVVTFFDGHKKCAGDYLYTFEKDDFTGRDIPIMNSPTWLDIYLIQNCKSEFVLERMKEVYNEEDYKSFLNVDLSAKPTSNFQQNRKITIRETEETDSYFSNRPFYLKNKRYDGMKWRLEHDVCDKSGYLFRYNESTKVWACYEMHYPTYSSTSRLPSLRSIVKHLRKQYLPIGVAFKIIGCYVGEEYIAYVH
jgi:hypothetical protein